MSQELCPFFGKCGGCLYQDLPWEQYVQKKQTFINRAFQDHGITVQVPKFSPLPLHIRWRATFAFQGNTLGYHGLKSHTIIPITECRLLKPDLIAVLTGMRAVIGLLKSTGSVSMATTPFGVDVHIQTQKKLSLTLPQIEELTAFARNKNLARLLINNDPLWQNAPLTQNPEEFRQPSAEGENLLKELVQQNLGNAKKILDLFCGGGTFTRPLIDKGLDVMGYDLADNVSQLGPHGQQRDLFRHPLTPAEFKDIDAVILDPPRAGALTQVQNLSHSFVPKIIMVSCSPKTAARDSKILIDAGWKLETLTPVDQFLWSNHIELVCVFNRSSFPTD